jgi:hypothetical protein
VALLFFWISYSEFQTIHASGYLRMKGGFILRDWTMYVNAAFPALVALIAIWVNVRKNDTSKGE